MTGPNPYNLNKDDGQPAANDPAQQQPSKQPSAEPNVGYQQSAYQPPGYQGDQQPGYQSPGYQQPGYPQPTSYPGYQAPGYGSGYPAGYPAPGQPFAVDKRPGPVIAAGIVLIVFGLLGVLLRAAAIGGVSAIDSSDNAELAGGLIAMLIGAVACLLAIGAGIMLLTSRSRAAAILGTVAAALLIFTCIGLIATIAVPILLWTQDSAKAWFAPQPPVPPYGAPPQY
ncbi:hypothetical protein GOEFS_037_00270 [Gordonia effusa NBRC 100432]|uniref:Uncharacterized protein n=1 Tax=Gordonia effusa NBRC 100432 TaxID=1077974 RepID=H0QY23_9ACTN|nr:hypothetical protein [Gordonia effusa]GAB17724.1 hypothetical protein GOEFS_037_00270 [Gordonia effusa NBRC 100432]